MMEKAQRIDEPDFKKYQANLDRHKVQLEQQKQHNDHQADTRSRIDSLVRYVLTVDGVALTVSMGIFAKPDKAGMHETTATILQWSWGLLFSSIIAMVFVMLILILGGYLVGEQWKKVDEGLQDTAEQPAWIDKTAWVSGGVGIIGFFAGLILLCIAVTTSI